MMFGKKPGLKEHGDREGERSKAVERNSVSPERFAFGQTAKLYVLEIRPRKGTPLPGGTAALGAA